MLHRELRHLRRVDPSVTVGLHTVLGVMPHKTSALARPIVPGSVGDLIIEQGCSIGSNTVIYQGVQVGPLTLVGDLVAIREGVRIGRECVIGQGVTINYDAYIGDRVRVMNGSHITGGMIVGDDTFIGVNVTTSNDKGIDPSAYEFDPERLAPPRIGSGCFIGSGANILPGVTIGHDCVIGPGALVDRDVPDGHKMIAIPDRRTVAL